MEKKGLSQQEIEPQLLNNFWTKSLEIQQNLMMYFWLMNHSDKESPVQILTWNWDHSNLN